MNQNVLRAAQGQAAVDRRVAVGLDESIANPFAWKKVQELPAGLLLRDVEIDFETGVGVAVGGGSGAVSVYRRSAAGQWAAVDGLPGGLLGHGESVTHNGSMWWIGGDDEDGGGWVAVSLDDGATWTDISAGWAAAGGSMPVRCVETLAGALLYVGGDGGQLLRLTVPVSASSWVDLSSALGFGSDAVLDVATDGMASVMVVGGAASAPAVVCAYSATGGATWADRTVALGSPSAAVRRVVRAASGVFAVGGDLLRVTRDGGASWEDWARDYDLQFAFPVRDLIALLGERAVVAASDLGAYLVMESGQIVLPLPVRLGQPVYGLSSDVRRAVMVADGIWESVRGGVVVTVSFFPTAVRLPEAGPVRLQGAGSHLVKAGRGVVTALWISSSAMVSEVVEVYDGATLIASIVLPASPLPVSMQAPTVGTFYGGLTVVLASDEQDVTVWYQ